MTSLTLYFIPCSFRYQSPLGAACIASRRNNTHSLQPYGRKHLRKTISNVHREYREIGRWSTICLPGSRSALSPLPPDPAKDRRICIAEEGSVGHSTDACRTAHSSRSGFPPKRTSNCLFCHFSMPGPFGRPVSLLMLSWPIFGIVGIACGGAGYYLYKLAVRFSHPRRSERLQAWLTSIDGPRGRLGP